MASSLSLWLLSLEDPRHLPGLSLSHTLKKTSLRVPAGSGPCCHDLPAYDTLNILTLNLCPTPSGSCLHHYPVTTQSRQRSEQWGSAQPHAQYYTEALRSTCQWATLSSKLENEPRTTRFTCATPKLWNPPTTSTFCPEP